MNVIITIILFTVWAGIISTSAQSITTRVKNIEKNCNLKNCPKERVYCFGFSNGPDEDNQNCTQSPSLVNCRLGLGTSTSLSKSLINVQIVGKLNHGYVVFHLLDQKRLLLDPNETNDQFPLVSAKGFGFICLTDATPSVQSFAGLVGDSLLSDPNSPRVNTATSIAGEGWIICEFQLNGGTNEFFKNEYHIVMTGNTEGGSINGEFTQSGKAFNLVERPSYKVDLKEPLNVYSVCRTSQASQYPHPCLFIFVINNWIMLGTSVCALI